MTNTQYYASKLKSHWMCIELLHFRLIVSVFCLFDMVVCCWRFITTMVL